MDCKAIRFSRHAIQRMFERSITSAEVRGAVMEDEYIAEYPEEKPLQSGLLLHFWQGRPVHIVVACDLETDTCYVITAYVPDPALWNKDYTVRKPW